MQDGQPSIYKQKNLTFIVTPKRVTVRTSLGQMFFLQPRQHYWSRRVNLIRAMLELEEIRNLHELASWCSNGSHENVIEWVSTSHKYNISNPKETVVQ